jgi:citrate synthase
MTAATDSARGLENVVVTATGLSAIDGVAGRLGYAGYPISDLAGQASFEEVCYLLWYGELPNATQLRDFTARLRAEAALTPAEQELVRSAPSVGHGMDALRTLVSGLGQLDPQADDLNLEGAERIGLRLVAKMPTLIAAWHRLRSGQEPVAPQAEGGHAANLLWMLHGREPSPTAARAFNTYMVLLAEHGLNASTFAARVAIGAQADIYCAVVGAIGTLKGLLHGGANQKAIQMLALSGAALGGKAGGLVDHQHGIVLVQDSGLQFGDTLRAGLGRPGFTRLVIILGRLAQRRNPDRLPGLQPR